jgi:uncharacterized protein YbbC (DUF1343 family)/CubicO group peptidase (beta-lactamase class C family)
MMRAALLLLLPLAAAAQERFAGSAAIDQVLAEAVRTDQIPGAVVIVGQPGKILHRKAYGYRALTPVREPMTLDTIFDAASLTKVVVTTPAIMKLVEAGKVRLNDKVTQYLPAFQGGKSDITVRQLLTHFSGLRPDVDLLPPWSGYETGIQKALEDKPSAPPGERFTYSDINFVLLGEIVRTVSGMPLDEFVQKNIFQPLSMNESRFNPPASLNARIAPTEREQGQVLRGVVHDPTSRFMGGVAGHAGLFTTAEDLTHFCEMMLGLGEWNGVRIFSPLTVRKFTEPNSPAHQPVVRGLGWDIDSPYSTPRGELFPLGSYGHTGFTGTSLWIDPATRTYVIVLTNSVHPVRRPSITSLRARIATATAAALGVDAPGLLLTGAFETAPTRALARNQPVFTGLDVLVDEKFARLQGKRVGLITNQTGLTRDGKRNIDVMLAAGVRVTALFSPEHGIEGKLDQPDVPDARDEKSGLPVYSLHLNQQFKPTPNELRGVEVLVFDIQDIGARFYTYISTMKYSMEAAARAGIRFVVLDRPNPITGTRVEGPMLDPAFISFIGCAKLPLRHGMTMGELARLLNAEENIQAQLEVVAMKNWRRLDWWDSTDLSWIDPSPNMRSLTAALLYPAVAMLEYSRDYSVGRGTDLPFEQIGAPWIDGQELSLWLNRRMLPGVRFYPVRFTPTASNCKGQNVQGVRAIVTDRESYSSLRTGLEIAYALGKLYPGKIDWKLNRKLIGSTEALAGIESQEDPRALEEQLQRGVEPFLTIRAKYLLYHQ